MKRTKKSQKKTKFLLLLIVLTAILSITATYAWFSTQKDVEISTLRLNIEVAESLEISLNGKEWTNKITISDMRQLYGTAASGHQASKYVNAESGSGNTNYVPKELLPVSTVGTVADGKLQFMRSNTFSGTTLNAIPCSEADLLAATAIGGTDGREANNKEHPYLVFDMYLKNLSAQTNGDDLRIATGSRVWADTINSDEIAGASTAGTGAENAMRVGFVQYMETMDATTADATGSLARTLDPNYTPVGEGATEQVAKVAIWEPNDLDHIQEIVNNNSRVTNLSQNVTTYGVVFKSTATADSPLVVDTTKAEEIENVISEQKTVKPAYNHSATVPGTTSAVPLITTGTASASDGTSVDGDINLPKNTISKFRVYVWLEGQDVDCVNTASMAGKVDINIRLDKDTITGTGGVSYATDASVVDP